MSIINDSDGIFRRMPLLVRYRDAYYPSFSFRAICDHLNVSPSFLTELSNFQMVFVEAFLLLMILILSLRLSAFSFSAGSLIVAAGYTGVAALLFLSSNIVLQIIRPLMMIGISLISIHVASAIENTRFFAKIEREKEVAERDLEIGRQIQAGFFPEKIPDVDGWEIAAFFKPARQVAGDFYDVFELRKTGKVIGPVGQSVRFTPGIDRLPSKSDF